MRGLITGGAGFIGSHLARACLAAGDEIRILDDFSSGHEANLVGLETVEVVRASIEDPAALAEALAGCEICYHLAAKPSVPLSIEDPVGTHATNVTGTLNVLEAARSAGLRRVVLASSCAVYGASQSLPLREDEPAEPLSPYALHKLMGELYARQAWELYGLETVSLRYFNVYGAGQDPASPYAAVVPLFTSALKCGSEPIIYGDGLQTRDFIHVDDVAGATRAAGVTALPEAGIVLNVGSGEQVSVLELFERIRHVAGRPEVKPRFALARSGECRQSQADISRTRRILAWRPRVSLAEGIERTVAAATLEAIR